MNGFLEDQKDIILIWRASLYGCYFILFLTAAAQLNQGKTPATAVQQQMMQIQRCHTEPGDAQRVRERKQKPGDDQALQAHIIQLEGQVQRHGTFVAAVFLPSTCRVWPSCVLFPRWRPWNWHKNKAKCCWRMCRWSINRTWSSWKTPTSKLHMQNHSVLHMCSITWFMS